MAAPKKAPRDRLTSRKRPMYEYVWIANDAALAQRVSELELKVEQAARQKAGDDKVAELEKTLEAARAECRADSTLFVARSIGHKRYEELVAAYPPSKDNVKDAEDQGIAAEQVIFDPDKFPPALLSESLYVVTEFDDDGKAITEEKVPEDEVYEIWDSPDWNVAELMSLFGACQRVNTQRRVVDLGNGSRQTRS